MGATIAAVGPQNGVALFAVAALAGLALITIFVPEIRKA
jgi:hypothetical protein